MPQGRGGALAEHREGHKIVQHPATGLITMDCDVLSEGDAERKIVRTHPYPWYRR